MSQQNCQKDLWLEWIQSEHAQEAFEQYKQSREAKQRAITRAPPPSKSNAVSKPSKPTAPRRA